MYHKSGVPNPIDLENLHHILDLKAQQKDMKNNLYWNLHSRNKSFFCFQDPEENQKPFSEFFEIFFKIPHHFWDLLNILFQTQSIYNPKNILQNNLRALLTF